MHLRANPGFPEDGLSYSHEELNAECLSLLQQFFITRYPIVQVVDMTVDSRRVFNAFDHIITDVTGTQDRVQVLEKRGCVFLIRKYS